MNDNYIDVTIRLPSDAVENIDKAISEISPGVDRSQFIERVLDDWFVANGIKKFVEQDEYPE